jgi:hypothetical protein
MKFFFSLFISFVVCSDFVITLDNLTNSYDKVRRLYFKFDKDEEFWDQFNGSHSHLKNFLVKTFETDPIGLFQKIEKSQNFQLCFIVIGCVQLSLNKKMSTHLWEEHLCAQSVPKTIAKKFYRWSKEIMHRIVRSEDWSKSKEILGILLSLQKKFLLLLGSSAKKEVQMRLAEYKFLCGQFDPSDFDTFLGTFVHLKSMALDSNGNFHKNLLNRKFIKLFKIHQIHFHLYRKELPWDPSKLDPKLLYFLIFTVRYRDFSDSMKTPPKLSLKYLTGLDVFQKTFTIYKETIKPNTISINDAMVNGSSDFIKFVRESIDSNMFALNESDHWYLKAILCLVPIYIY